MSLPARRALLAVAAGVLGGACWLPLGLAPALPLAGLLAMRGLRLCATSREALAFGLVFGAVRYAVASHFLLWLLSYSPLAIVFYLLGIAYIVPFALLEAWGAVWLERRGGLPRSLGFAAIYATLEKVRTLGDVSFPADLLAHAFGAWPGFLAWSPWIGPFGMTLLVLAVAALADLALEERRRPALAGALAAAAALLWVAPLLTDALFARTPETAGQVALRVGIVQPAVTVQDKLDRGRWPAMWSKLEQLTREAARGADLVVWPETARPGPVLWKEGAFRDPPMEELAARVGVPILYGCDIARFEGERPAAIYNGAALVGPGAAGGSWYGKQRLLPFVEGVPLAGWLGYDPSKRRRGSRTPLTMLGNFSPGPGPQVLEVGPLRVGVLVCYEGLYPALARAYRNAGANALSVLTNDAWWGRSLFAPWHASMVSSRARELDLPVFRAANSGVSSSTTARGDLKDRTRLFEVRTIQVKVEPSSSPPTFYARHGDLAVGLCLLVIAGAALRPAFWRAFEGRGGRVFAERSLASAPSRRRKAARKGSSVKTRPLG